MEQLSQVTSTPLRFALRCQFFPPRENQMGSSGFRRAISSLADLLPLQVDIDNQPVLVRLEKQMPDVTVERRSAPRYPMVLAAQVLELPRGAKLSARSSDISRTGCYIDTLNPSPVGTKVRLRLTHNEEVFEATEGSYTLAPVSGWELPSRKSLPKN